ncbi:hypothetical protein OH492_13935 [Vibrio chagasii]|nr:hypothetical protein [Vibrio chagasii]
MLTRKTKQPMLHGIHDDAELTTPHLSVQRTSCPIRAVSTAPTEAGNVEIMKGKRFSDIFVSNSLTVYWQVILRTICNKKVMLSF